jgi:hypothetical protein
MFVLTSRCEVCEALTVSGWMLSHPQCLMLVGMQLCQNHVVNTKGHECCSCSCMSRCELCMPSSYNRYVCDARAHELHSLTCRTTGGACSSCGSVVLACCMYAATIFLSKPSACVEVIVCQVAASRKYCSCMHADLYSAASRWPGRPASSRMLLLYLLNLFALITLIPAAATCLLLQHTIKPFQLARQLSAASACSMWQLLL